jgi:hypothetical protein
VANSKSLSNVWQIIEIPNNVWHIIKSPGDEGVAWEEEGRWKGKKNLKIKKMLTCEPISGIFKICFYRFLLLFLLHTTHFKPLNRVYHIFYK